MALKMTGEAAAVEYEGCVIETRERNGYDDSDFYAIVWDAERGAVRFVEYATTRGWTYDAWAKVDATDDAKAKAEAWAADEFERLMKLSDEAKAKKVEVGKTVAITRVYRSRKLKVTLAEGTTGVVRRYERGFGEPYAERYGRSVPMRAMVEFAAGTLWLDEFDIEVVGHESHLTDAGEVREWAERKARSCLAGRESLASLSDPGWFVV